MVERRVGATIRMMKSFETRTPHIAPPLVLILVQGSYFFILTLFLGWAVVVQLGHGYYVELSQQALTATAGLTVPILVAYGISTNRTWTRWAIPASYALLAAVLVRIFGFSGNEDMWAAALASILPVAMIFVCYWRVDTRIYYLEIAEEPVPDRLRERLGRVHAGLSRSVVEKVEDTLITVGVLFAIFGMIYAYLQMGASA